MFRPFENILACNYLTTKEGLWSILAYIKDNKEKRFEQKDIRDLVKK
jgi:hypothetical protein